jgi:hypothetical protein
MLVLVRLANNTAVAEQDCTLKVVSRTTHGHKPTRYSPGDRPHADQAAGRSMRSDDRRGTPWASE